DIGCYFERYDITSILEFEKLSNLQEIDVEYINLIRNIAFRVYIYTNTKDMMTNWLVAENLAKNYEWVEAITIAANFYKKTKMNNNFIDNVRSETVKKYYYPFTQKF
ncbi:MAG: hypothetical protein LBV08_01505, partial [Clostridiales bacterium]|nr:hypothetical protein [Clostridiales bacterium]